MKSVLNTLQTVEKNYSAICSDEGQDLEAVLQNRNEGDLTGSFDIFGLSCGVKFEYGGKARTQNADRDTTASN